MGGIVAFRNVLMHWYATVEHERVWQVVAETLPELRASVAMLLDERGPI